MEQIQISHDIFFNIRQSTARPGGMAGGRVSMQLGGSERVRVPSPRPSTSGVKQTTRDRADTSAFGRAMVASKGMVPRTKGTNKPGTSASVASRPSPKQPVQRIPSRSRLLSTTRVDCIQRSLTSRGYSVRAVSAIVNAHRTSTRVLYDKKWEVFMGFCKRKNLAPLEVATHQVADFLVGQ